MGFGLSLNAAVWLALGAAVLAVVYGLVSANWILGQSPGTRSELGSRDGA